MNAVTRLRGLLASLALVAFVIGTPVFLLYARSMPDFSVFSWDRLKARDDGTLAVAVIYLACWILWAIFTISVINAAISMIRGVQAPRLPGLALPQVAANQLVGAAALLFMSLPVATASVAPTPATYLAVQPVAQPASDQTPAVNSAGPAPVTESKPPHPQTVAYTVKHGDSLWRIAEQHLGSGTRYTEIAELNEQVLRADPDYLEPGLVLRLPAPPSPENDSEETYVVQPGDTLSEIAAEELGDADAYPQIFDASTDSLQTDGTRLTDPDLIRPGWRLTIPTASKAQVSGRGSPYAPPTAPVPAPRHPSPTASPDPSPSPPEPSATNDRPLPETDDHQTTSETSESTPSWVLPGLTGGGALLAGALLIALRNHRRTQLRNRRPGHIIASPPSDLMPVAKTARFAGSVTAPDILGLNHLLETLSDTVSPLPRLEMVELPSQSATLHLATDATLPEPWSGEGSTWSAPLPADSPEPDYSSPYPLLISIGTDAAGHTHLLNLEEHPDIALTGDIERAAAFARHVTAELCFAPWSVMTTVDTIGVADELTFDSDKPRIHGAGWRHTHHDQDDSAFIHRLISSLKREHSVAVANEPDTFELVIATAERTELVDQVAEAVRTFPGRSGAATILITDSPRSNSTIITFTEDGRLHIPTLGVDLAAPGLSAEEAAVCTAIYGVTDHSENLPVPDDPTSTTSDAAGALRSELTEPRPAQGQAGAASLLPNDTETYVTAHSTTREDLETLAPVTRVPDPQPEAAADTPAADKRPGTDDALDSDVETWFDPDCPHPRLTFLGPVTVTAHGDVMAVAGRKPFHVEMLSYLVLHPKGVPGAQIAEDFGITIGRVRTHIGNIRKWLGTNPRTGQPHLPHADTSDASGARGSAIYRVEDVLTDWDLFKRLRTRGQLRGAEGIDDLIAALDLVTGEPFSHLRPAGWAWLDELGLSDIAQCAVVDTAHIVTAHALEQQDTNLALVTVEIACKAAPYDEISRLDRIHVKKATGDASGAATLLNREVFNRTDDHLGPVELSDRTTQLVEAHAKPGTSDQQSTR